MIEERKAVDYYSDVRGKLSKSSMTSLWLFIFDKWDKKSEWKDEGEWSGLKEWVGNRTGKKAIIVANYERDCEESGGFWNRM